MISLNPFVKLLVKVPSSAVYILTFNFSIGHNITSAITSAQAEAVKKPTV